MPSRRNSDPTPPLPLLVTGLAGVPGYNAFHDFRRRYGSRVVGTRRTDNWPLAGEGIVACDLHEPDMLKRLFDEHQFRAVLYCEGTCKLKSCELNPALAWRVNVGGMENLLNVTAGSDVRLVYLSVDLVYSGKPEGGYVETDPTDPVTVYGSTMAATEQLVLRERPDAAGLRISLPMGVSFNGHAGAIDWIQSRFVKSKPATLFYDEIRTPTYTDCLNRLFATMLANDLSGLFHAGGPRRMSLFQIAQVINRIGGYDPRLLEGKLRSEAPPVPPRAGDVTLNSHKLTKALGHDPFDPWPYFDEHLPTHREWHHERSAAQPGSPEFLAEVLYRNPARQSAERAAS